jgi:hypothetical protein
MKMCHQEEFEVKQSDELIHEEIVTEMPSDALSGHDLPPKLELEEHKPIPRHRIFDEQGNDITNTPEVQQLIASGEIQFNDGEEIILVDQVIFTLKTSLNSNLYVKEASGDHLEYFEEPEPIQSKAESSRQRQSSRNYTSNELDVSMNEASSTTRRSNRLSRSYNNKEQEEELEGEENEMDTGEVQEVNANSRRSTRRKKGNSF